MIDIANTSQTNFDLNQGSMIYFIFPPDQIKVYPNSWIFNQTYQSQLKRSKDLSDRIGQLMLAAYILLFLLFLVLPLGALIIKSVQDSKGHFIGLSNYVLYLKEPALFQSFFNSLFIAIVSTIFVVVFAFLFAYAITRTCMPFKGFFRLIALIPLLSPSILAAIALVYRFGNKGI